MSPAEEIVSASKMKKILDRDGWKHSIDEGRLTLAEIMLKTGAGYDVSYTEIHFANSFDLLKRDMTPNKRGYRFLCSMFYGHSNLKPEAYSLMEKYRR